MSNTAGSSPGNDEKERHSASLLSKSTQGATYLILLQVGSRALTFVVNQILLRFLSPNLLGISTQLELYSVSVLYFARESLRVTLQRQSNDGRYSGNSGTSKNKKVAESYEQSKKIQEVVNLAYLAVVLGVPLACVFGYLYARSADVAVLLTPYIHETLGMYCISTILELLNEPQFAVSQQQMLYGTRASAESLAAFSRCIVTCASAIWASKTNVNLGALPFAIGQLTYAIILGLVYASKILPLTTQRSFSLLPRPISNSPSPLLLSRFSLTHLTLVTNLYAQSVFKQILTTGDSLLIATLTSLESQGAYTLATNYGGLLARTIFQPIEESSRSLFGRLLPPLPRHPHQQPPSNLQSPIHQARTYLVVLLRAYTLLSLPLILLAPPLCPPLLSFVAGSLWTSTSAPHVLAAYCYYIPLLAINGILEA
ncbi:MAG: hypothetical protein Q9190_006284, partial [Brigantiaea leucoxantha]